MSTKGFKMSDESRARMAAAHTGKKQSEEHIRKRTEQQIGRTFEKKYEYVCAVCATAFRSASTRAKFCSKKCQAAKRGRIDTAEFSGFERICAVCGATNELVGDHHHPTGLARGVLCRPCNLAIGNMSDDPSRLRAAADYLEKWTP